MNRVIRVKVFDRDYGIDEAVRALGRRRFRLDEIRDERSFLAALQSVAEALVEVGAAEVDDDGRAYLVGSDEPIDEVPVEVDVHETRVDPLGLSGDVVVHDATIRVSSSMNRAARRRRS